MTTRTQTHTPTNATDHTSNTSPRRYTKFNDVSNSNTMDTPPAPHKLPHSTSDPKDTPTKLTSQNMRIDPLTDSTPYQKKHNKFQLLTSWIHQMRDPPDIILLQETHLKHPNPHSQPPPDNPVHAGNQTSSSSNNNNSPHGHNNNYNPKNQWGQDRLAPWPGKAIWNPATTAGNGTAILLNAKAPLDILFAAHDPDGHWRARHKISSTTEHRQMYSGKYNKLQTDRNTEAMGVILGLVNGPVLTATHVVLPPQVGTPDTVDSTDEVGVALQCINNGLQELGWIHTHPNHNCFLSSIDIHTHAGKQRLLEESVAIVLAPNERVQRLGIFSIKGPREIQQLLQCTKRGFHPDHQFPRVFQDHPSVTVIDDDQDRAEVARILDLRNPIPPP